MLDVDGRGRPRATPRVIENDMLMDKNSNRVVARRYADGFDGSYSITVTMPSVPAGSEQYKIVPYSPDCSLPCDSGKFNAAGKLFVHQ